MTQKEQAQLEVIHRDLVEVKEDITELKLKLLNPDDGAIARANRNTNFRKQAEPLLTHIDSLIKFKKDITRVIWIVVTTLIATLVRLISTGHL